MSETCQRRTLAATPTCRVHLCDCGAVQLEIGPLTLRLDAEAITSVGATVCEAIRQLRVLGELPLHPTGAERERGRGHAH